ncbi:inositol monophosphatase family protein, partial [Kitasatospora aureofaciens]
TSKGEVIVGVVYDPSQDELFWAEKGKEAFVNGKELKVAGTEDVARSVIATGFPSTPLMREAVLKGIGELGPRCQTMRVLGSAALHLAYVAAGRLTAFWGIWIECLGCGGRNTADHGGRGTGNRHGRKFLQGQHASCCRKQWPDSPRAVDVFASDKVGCVAEQIDQRDETRVCFKGEPESLRFAFSFQFSYYEET